ncbi:Pre-mRNA splicing Prp18-interacting factor-domain-containing protein [Limtongia smithiae]|uniref:Pre-mRNA splicing Prp18-interacting factor-domain-containing protein n=1 Tax=Limtongia smithiae TaxID=1125753 RepID=UPI0034CDF585
MSKRDSAESEKGDSSAFKFNTFSGSAQPGDPSTSQESLYKRPRRGKDKDAPIEHDADGKEINPYIPQFISKAPWYVDQSGEVSLRHQRLQHDRDKYERELKDVWYQRGLRAGPAATKYRKGACENCGAMSHKTKDCMERPRKLGAKWTGKDIQADELVQDVPMTWDSKRDRWNGYDVSEHVKVIEEYQKLEDLRQQALDARQEEGGDVISNDHYDTEGAKMPGQGYDSNARMSTRTLRIREDTAKYLKNLDSNGEYNPKSRTMKGEHDGGLLANDDDFVPQSDNQAAEFEALKRFAWDSAEKGTPVHLQANPTEGALYKRKIEREEQEKNDKTKTQLLQKYGGSEFMRELPKELKTTPSEEYSEYNAAGELIKGKRKQVARSKYEEDIYPGNHSSVWGSYWESFKWGYACCHSTIKQSYCTGFSGIEAAAEKVIEVS